MKYATYRRDGVLRVGIVDGSELVDPQAVEHASGELGPQAGWFANMTEVIRHAPQSRELAQCAVALSAARGIGRLALKDAELCAPMLPSTILCAGSNYLSHNAEKASSDTSGKEPEFFVKTADCVVGPSDDIVHDSALTRKLDGEVELAVVIGKPGRHIPRERALDHVFGYTIVNDVTARDRQVRFRPDGSSWYELGRGKVFDTSAPIGPFIADTEDIPDPQDLGIRSWVNGELRQNSHTGQMIWSVAELVHVFSINLTLRPGMVIITGTPSGTAWSTDKELGGKWSGGNGIVPAAGYLQPGDVIECEIDGIGRLRNRVIAA
ncbi:MAG: fumarylacetoacetate hydrolase family protein [Pigmentiphaga sp.]|uniref:fumarylacetoacetate hydrolase family protein n=1 Tax=Pigmentiphaga sp. TaxID=1977564 RepID=UPI0029B2E19B|nr:fumarylacetoacetate hydrolase family protein [Pigmentiphaga sp.]MDX3904161.1 fumarylacetoacetate hydrolase family protein [Pigmentiphaga sp.]